MDPFYRELEELSRAEEPAAMATVIAARGSTPRGIGARMIVRRDGTIRGSVGGGCGEAQVFLEAVRVIEQGRARLCEVDLSGEINDSSPTHCGGVMQVFVDLAQWGAPAAAGLSSLGWLRAVQAAVRARQALAVIVAVENPGGLAGVAPGSKWLVNADGTLQGEAPGGLAGALRAIGIEALASGLGGCAWLAGSAAGWGRARESRNSIGLYLEVLAPASQLVIAGAGHIGLALCRMAKQLDFEVAVIDDRAAFANRARFPEADEVLVGPIAELLQARPLGPGAYLVLVTRGHQQDEAALKVAIGSPAAYLGMIGSRRRVREVFRHLADSGVPRALLARVHAPIGLDLGARTPAEIAVSIVAQLVRVRAERDARGAAPASTSGRRRIVLVKGAGDLATGCAVRLHRAGFAVAMTELAAPTAVRRTVAFSESVIAGSAEVEGVRARRAGDYGAVPELFACGEVAVLVDPEGRAAAGLGAEIVVDARMAKRNLGTSLDEASIVIGLGPGFAAGRDVHAVVETNRGHALGSVILEGEAQANTGVPGEIAGRTTERLLRAPAGGALLTRCAIGDRIEAGAVVGEVAGRPVVAGTEGIVRGLLREGSAVREGQKIGDVDPRARREHCFSVSDKARAVAGGVLEAILYFSSVAKPSSARAALPMSARSSRGAPRASRRRASS